MQSLYLLMESTPAVALSGINLVQNLMIPSSSLEKIFEKEIWLDFCLLSDHLVSSDSSGMFLSQSICPFQSQQHFRGLFGTSGKGA